MKNKSCYEDFTREDFRVIGESLGKRLNLMKEAKELVSKFGDLRYSDAQAVILTAGAIKSDLIDIEKCEIHIKETIAGRISELTEIREKLKRGE